MLIEAKTMRMRGHAQHDSADYVPKEMFAYWKERDPIPRYEKYLTENGILDAKKKAGIDARIEKLVAKTASSRKTRHSLRRNSPNKAFTATAATPSKQNGNARSQLRRPPIPQPIR